MYSELSLRAFIEIDSLPPSPSLLAEASQPFVLQPQTADERTQNRLTTIEDDELIADASQSTQGVIPETGDIARKDIEISSNITEQKAPVS